jgi:hypothetical protein
MPKIEIALEGSGAEKGEMTLQASRALFSPPHNLPRVHDKHFFVVTRCEWFT